MQQVTNIQINPKLLPKVNPYVINLAGITVPTLKDFSLTY